jgi:hypothetical protein
MHQGFTYQVQVTGANMLSRNVQRKRTSLAVMSFILFFAANAALAQNHYAIASVIGDKVTISYSQRETGTMLDPNRKTELKLSEQGLDGEVLLIISKLVKAQCGSCKTTLFNVKAVDTPEEGEKLLPGLLGAAQLAKADRLIVLTKYRDQARLRFIDQQAGQGKFTGLGFFVDRKLKVKDIKTLDTTTGYLAPYAYFKLHVIDVVTGDVLISQGLTTSRAYNISVNQTEEFDPWNALTEPRKIEALLELVRLELERVLDLKKFAAIK